MDEGPVVLRERTERMRQQALDYQLAHPGEDHWNHAMMGELDCMVELDILREKETNGKV